MVYVCKMADNNSCSCTVGASEMAEDRRPYTVGASISVSINPPHHAIADLHDVLLCFIRSELMFAQSHNLAQLCTFLNGLLSILMIGNVGRDGVVRVLRSFIEERCHVSFGYLGSITDDQANLVFSSFVDKMKQAVRSICFQTNRTNTPTKTCVGLCPDPSWAKLLGYLVSANGFHPDPGFFLSIHENMVKGENSRVDALMKSLNNLNHDSLQLLSSYFPHYERQWHFNVYDATLADTLRCVDMKVSVRSIFLKQVGRGGLTVATYDV